MSKNIYGYSRCSTNDTKQEIQTQVHNLMKKGVLEKNIFLEYESGRKTDRKELTHLLNTVKPGDTIVTTEVSRFTRSTRHLCDIVEFTKDNHLCLIIGSFVVDCRNGEKKLDPMTEGALKMWGVFSEMERNMTVTRINMGLDYARSKGVKLGRPQMTKEDIPFVFYRYYHRHVAGEMTITELARLCECSRPTIYRWIDLENKTEV